MLRDSTDTVELKLEILLVRRDTYFGGLGWWVGASEIEIRETKFRHSISPLVFYETLSINTRV